VQAALDDYQVAIDIAERKHFARRWDVYLKRAELNGRAGRADQAIADATRALALSPGPLPGALRVRAEAYAQQGRVEESQADLAALSALPPGAP
jgi:tetratricopeptide (TPR) repeat protein